MRHQGSAVGGEDRLLGLRMTRLRILSDLHLEFHRDGGRTFTASQSDPDYDVLVLAGDITTAENLRGVLGQFRAAAGSRPIVFVAGNHEYYGSSVVEVGSVLTECSGADPLLHVLDNHSVLIDGQRFVGSTLWFPHSGKRERPDSSLNDFQQIEGFRRWVGQQADRSAAFLRANVRSGDVVVTHHLPHPRSVHPTYADSPLNRYFLHDVGDLVERGGAALWIHGHTHRSLDYRAGGTRVRCNPFGYLRLEENREFDERLTVEVG